MRSGKSFADLRWHPQPSSGPAGHTMPIRDGWRDLGRHRRWRVAFDLDRYERSAFSPAVETFNPATE